MKLALDLQLQTYQILTNNDQMLILCPSYYFRTFFKGGADIENAFLDLVTFRRNGKIQKI